MNPVTKYRCGRCEAICETYQIASGHCYERPVPAFICAKCDADYSDRQKAELCCQPRKTVQTVHVDAGWDSTTRERTKGRT